MNEEFKRFLRFNAVAWVLFYWLLRTSQGVIFDKPLIYMVVDLSDTCVGFLQCLLLRPALDRFIGQKTILRGFTAFIAIVTSVLFFKAVHDLIYQQVFPPEVPYSLVQSVTTGLYLPGYIFIVWSICYAAWQAVRQQARSQEEALRAKAKISALNAELVRRQMVPHFVFNTLNLLVATALKEKAFHTKDLLVKFSELLRYVAERGESGISSLGREINFALDYMDIQSSRFGHRVIFQHNLAQLTTEALSMEVPVLLIQPLLENVIQHAVEQYKETIEVQLQADLKDNGFRLLLTNTLPAGSYEPKEGSSLGTGLAGLKSRLLENFGTLAQVQVNAAPDLFSVSVFVPGVDDGGVYFDTE
ncbi:sensor histidine kinase [Kordiimonas aquimaris]|uniref:sensor histidine kinase n=1 Tax=Kordiimonas aquimaris TaxID=707591 RepID=UPI0021CF95C9|nr:histidine kinase [Kordiimonas aquimaris]